MEYVVKTLEDGKVDLTMGENGVTFDKDVSTDDVVTGVSLLIEQALGTSPFELTLAVLKEFNKE
jgi:hypothetical protein